MTTQTISFPERYLAGDWARHGVIVRVYRDYDDDGRCVGFLIRKLSSTHQASIGHSIFSLWDVLYDGRVYTTSARMFEPIDS